MFLSSICLNRPQSFGIGALAVSVFVLFFEGSGMPCPARGYPPGGYCPGGYCPGGDCPGGDCPAGYCPPYCAAAVPSPSTKISATPLHQPARQIRCAKFRYTISLTSDASRFPPVTPVFPWDIHDKDSSRENRTFPALGRVS